MHTMKALIKREFLEHRGAFLYAPAILLSIVCVAVAFLLVAGNGELEGEYIVAPTGATMYTIGVVASYVVWSVYLTAALFFYYADSFSADRRNNALLFWESVPQSDLKILTSKALSGITIFAALIFGFALITGAIVYLVLVAVSFQHPALNAPGFFEALQIYVQMGFVAAIYYFVVLLTQAPALAWVAGLSTLFRRWSIPLAFLIPGTVVLLEFINSIIGFGNSRPIAEFLERWFDNNFNEDIAAEILTSPAGGAPFELLKLVLSSTDWLSVAIGLVLTAGVVYLASEYRRRRIGA